MFREGPDGRRRAESLADCGCRIVVRARRNRPADTRRESHKSRVQSRRATEPANMPADGVPRHAESAASWLVLPQAMRRKDLIWCQASHCGERHTSDLAKFSRWQASRTWVTNH